MEYDMYGVMDSEWFMAAILACRQILDEINTTYDIFNISSFRLR